VYRRSAPAAVKWPLVETLKVKASEGIVGLGAATISFAYELGVPQNES
jgi:hypothetical protein